MNKLVVGKVRLILNFLTFQAGWFACVLGAAPNAVDALEKILDCVDSCACVSSPMTISQVMALRAVRSEG